MHALQTVALSSQFCGVLILDLKCIADELKATAVVLQGQQHIQTQPFPTVR